MALTLEYAALQAQIAAEVTGKTDPGSITPEDVGENISDAARFAKEYVEESGYKSYLAIISQTGTDAPFAVTVIKNTLGATVTFGYSLTGNYTVNSTGSFVEDKTVVFFGGSIAVGYATGTRTSNDVVSLRTAGFGGSNQNSTFNNTVIEIRVYP